MKTKELLDILSAVKPGLAKKEIVQQSTHFIFSGKQVVTYNDRICVSFPLETPFSVSVKADDLYKILSGIPDEEVELTKTEDQFLIKSKSTKAGLKTIESEKGIEKYIEALELENIIWKPLPKDFIKGISLCRFSASNDQSLGPLTCVAVNENSIWSSDDYRISYYNMEGHVKDEMLLPSMAVSDLCKFNMNKYSSDNDSWIHFTDDQVIFSVRRKIENYPNPQEFFVVEGNTIQVPDNLREALGITDVITENAVDLDKRVEIAIDEDEIVCKAESDKGWVERKVFGKFNVLKPIKFEANPIFLAEVLTLSTDMTLGESSILFKSQCFQHVIALPA